MKTAISIIAWTVGIMLVVSFFAWVKASAGDFILVAGFIWLVGGLLLSICRIAKWGYTG